MTPPRAFPVPNTTDHQPSPISKFQNFALFSVSLIASETPRSNKKFQKSFPALGIPSKTNDDFWFFAVFGGMRNGPSDVLQAESLECESLGWSAQRAAPGETTPHTLPALNGRDHSDRYECQPFRPRRFDGRAQPGLASAQAFTLRAFSPSQPRATRPRWIPPLRHLYSTENSEEPDFFL